MTRLLQAIAVLALAGVGWLCCEAAWTVRQLRPKLQLTVENLDRTVIITGAAAGDVERGARAWEQASKSQATNTSQAMSNVSAAAARLISLLSSTDASLNSSIFPAITATLNQQNRALLENQTKLGENLSRMASATAQLQATLADADKAIGSPAVQASLDNTQEATRQLAAATGQFTAAVTDLRQIADKARDTYLKPVNLWWGLVKELLPLAGSAAQVVK